MSETNPPLPMLIFHVWQMFGRSEIFLRSLPLIFNALTVPVVFALGRRMRGTGAGLVSAALFAAAAGMVDLSLIYRYPALLTLLGGIFVLLYFKSAGTKPVFSPGLLVLLAAVEIAGLYTHYFFIFAILGVNLIVLWDVAISKKLPAKRFVAWLAGQAVAGAAFVPASGVERTCADTAKAVVSALGAFAFRRRPQNTSGVSGRAIGVNGDSRVHNRRAINDSVVVSVLCIR
jgi:uncharacterized membrane protein